MVLAPPSVMPGARGCHLGGEADRGSRRSGRAAGTPARTVRMPPVSSICSPVRPRRPGHGLPDGRNAGRMPEDAGQSRAEGRTQVRDHPAGRASGRRPGPGTSRRNRRCGSQAAGAQEGTAARNVRAPVPAITLSDSQGQEERAQCRLICTGTVPSIRSAGGAQNDTFCRVCSPLQMCGGDVGTLVLFGQTSDSLRKEAAVLGPVAPEPTTTHPPAACPA